MFDSLARLPLDSKLVTDARRDPAHGRRLARRPARRHRRAGGPRRRGDRGHRRERAGARALRARAARRDGVGSILLEGGPHLAGAFLDAEEVDEIRLFLAPIVLGGKTGRDPLEGEGVELIADAGRALSFECEHIGDDLLVSARLKEW